MSSLVSRYYNRDYPEHEIFYNDEIEKCYINFLKKEGTAKAWTALSYYVDPWERKYCLHRALEKNPNYIPALIELVIIYYRDLSPRQIIKHCMKIFESGKHCGRYPYRIFKDACYQTNESIFYKREMLRMMINQSCNHELKEVMNSADEIKKIFGNYQIPGLSGISQIIQENLELSYAPGSKEYEAAKEHYQAIGSIEVTTASESISGNPSMTLTEYG